MMLLLGLLLLPGGESPLTVRPGKAPNAAEVTAALPPGLRDKLPPGKLKQEVGEPLLRFCLVGEGGAEGDPILGTYERAGDALVFRPRYSLAHGQLYRARFQPPGAKALVAEYRVPARPPGPPALVEQVYPRDDTLPANHLRFHICFSRPMRGGQDIFDHIRILGPDGEEVVDPWLRDELWADGDTRLILYIHPGRIKWGVLLRLLLGPVLVPDRQYTLVVGPGLLDADGRPLGKEYRKTFRTTAEDRKRLDLSAWQVKAPAAGSVGALEVRFPGPMDRFLLPRGLKVVDAQGGQVEGKSLAGKDERSWHFVPKSAWQDAGYRVVADEELEDAAGNTPRRPFDRDLEAPLPPPQPLSLSFRPTARPK